MNADDLLAAGFREHQPNGVLDKYDTLYQLKVRDENGIRYFINVYFWRHSKYGQGIHDGWEAEVVSGGGAAWWGNALWLSTSCGERTAAEVTGWANQMWERLALNYYERDT